MKLSTNGQNKIKSLHNLSFFILLIESKGQNSRRGRSTERATEGSAVINTDNFVGRIQNIAGNTAFFASNDQQNRELKFLFKNLITHQFVNSYFNSMLMSYIKSTISSFMIREKISFLDVTAYLLDLSRACNELVSKEFERFGIEIMNLSIETISPPPSDYESLKKMKEKQA